MPCTNCKDDICQNKCAPAKPKFPYRFPPMAHQRSALARAVKAGPAFGFFHAMGAGKTFTVINLLYYRHQKGQITGALIICPTPIKNVWSVEVEKCAPEGADFSVHVFKSGGTKAAETWMDKSKDSCQVLVVGVEALSQGGARDMASVFLRRHRATGSAVVVDESSKMKNATAVRTKSIIKMGQLADYRYIMTGTPVSQGLHDLYAQLTFLDPNILGIKSYVLFRNLYCIMGGFEGRKIIGYQREEELMEKMRPYVDMVTKEQALPELPPKIYNVTEVTPTKQQRTAMKELEDTMAAQQGDLELTTATVMDRLTRYQQILGGHFPHEDEDGQFKTTPIAGKNPKLEALVQLLELDWETGTKSIIWARFTAERNCILDAIRHKFGEDSVRLFDGQVSGSDRAQYTVDFQQSDGVRFMVANVTVGGMGQTWTAATHEIYYSNDFSYENRMQSEDRAHRKGQKNSVKYTDIVAEVKADKMILQALARKGDVADMVKDELTADWGESQ